VGVTTSSIISEMQGKGREKDGPSYHSILTRTQL
jgi:hypothetical protein